MAASSPGFVPNFEPIFAPNEPDDREGNPYRLLIGGLGFALPIAVWLISGFRHMKIFEHRWELLPSISSYYYTGSNAVLVGVLVSFGLYFLSYEGYGTDDNYKDRRASRIAGWAALCVAAFPTEAPHGSLVLSWWTDWTSRIHYTSAAVLFGSFAYMSWFLFTKSNPAIEMSTGKKVRNSIYKTSACIIGACIAWIAAIEFFTDAPVKDIFLPEALAIEAFALSWLAKGRADRTAVSIAQRAIYYGHPRRLIAGIRTAIGG